MHLSLLLFNFTQWKDKCTSYSFTTKKLSHNMCQVSLVVKYTLIIYVQYTKGYKKNVISFREIVQERFSAFRISQHFKRLNFDHLSSETVSKQKIKIKNYFFDDCVFLEIRLNHGNHLSLDITRNK